jgi:hypothetical protein
MNYYVLLGVDPKSSRKEIKAAYHRLARQYHPDVNPNNPSSEERFKQINAAYEVLSDPHRRAAYDRSQSVYDRPRWSHTRQRRTTYHRSHARPTSSTTRSRYSVEEMNYFVISRIQRQVAREAIIQELHEWAGIGWLQAADFVRYAEVIYRCDLARRRRHILQLARYGSVCMAGMTLNFLMGMLLVTVYPGTTGFAGVIMLMGWFLFIGGLTGSIRTLNDMKQ